MKETILPPQNIESKSDPFTATVLFIYRKLLELNLVLDQGSFAEFILQEENDAKVRFSQIKTGTRKIPKKLRADIPRRLKEKWNINPAFFSNTAAPMFINNIIPPPLNMGLEEPSADYSTADRNVLQAGTLMHYQKLKEELEQMRKDNQILQDQLEDKIKLIKLQEQLLSHLENSSSPTSKAS